MDYYNYTNEIYQTNLSNSSFNYMFQFGFKSVFMKCQINIIHRQWTLLKLAKAIGEIYYIFLFF